MNMVDWLDKFATERGKMEHSMKKTASKFIVDKEVFPTVKNNDIVEYKKETYRVVDSNFKDEQGTGVLLQKCAGIENADPMDVAMGTSEAYEKHQNGAQEYAYVDPKINDPSPEDEEVKKFNEEAEQTQKAIDAENAIDGTSGATRPNRILQRMFEKFTEENNTSVDEDNRFEIVDDEIVDTEEVTVDADDELINLECYNFDDEEVVEASEDEEIGCNDINCNDISKLENEFKVVSNRISSKLKR